MKVQLTNQENPNTATAVIEVGCGPDGEEWNEPSLTYTVNADGLEIHRMTDHGENMGHAKLSVGDIQAICQVPYLTQDQIEAAKARIFPGNSYNEGPAAGVPEGANSVLVPVRMANGKVEFLPLSERDTPTYCIIVVSEKAAVLDTPDPNGDRVAIGGVTLEEAIGKFLMANPHLSYNDIMDHMEV